MYLNCSVLSWFQERSTQYGGLMKKSTQLPWGLLSLILALPFTPFAVAGGTVSVCDELHLKSAIAAGGDVTITCLDPITVTSTIQIFNFTRIFGRPDPNVWGPHISGGGHIQIMAVRAG